MIRALAWRAIGAGLLAIALFFAGWVVNGWRKNAEIDRMKTEQSEERTRQALAQVKAVDEARIEEQRRTAAQTEIANVATKDAETARRDARAAGAASEQLRQRVAALVREYARPGDPASASGSAPAGDPIRMLADVLGRADRRAGILAEIADASRIAGLACERAYDSLRLVQYPW